MDPSTNQPDTMGRRAFLGWASSRGAMVGAAGLGLPTLLAACGNDDGGGNAQVGAGGAGVPETVDDARAIVGDVVDFALSSDEWAGDFGFVTLAVRAGAVDGSDVWFVRTDASGQSFAEAEQLVHVPKLASLSAEGLSGAAYVVDGVGDDNPVVFSTEPGRNDYTPAWTLHRVSWSGEPRPLRAAQEVLDAEAAGALSIERTDVVINAGIVKWSRGEMAVDTERTAYLGKGQLLEPVDTAARRATFKLAQCFPASRYFVLDHSVAPAAEMTHTLHSPRLHDGPSQAGATGRTNVFMGGLVGPGPMGAQPSVFDFDAGDPAWSPYWDHFTYVWDEGVEARLLTSQAEIHEARDAGDLEEFAGTPEMTSLFTVNCPVPVLAPVTYRPSSAG